MAFAHMHYNGVIQMRLPLSAIEAFAQDFRNPTPAGVDGSDRAHTWLTIASAAEALGALRGRKLNEFLREFDQSMLPPVGVRPSIVHDVAPAPVSGLSLVTERFRVAAEEMERGGYLNLAYTTVSALCRVMVREDRPTRLMTTMHLGRIARQLSDIPVAIDCYRSVALTGLRERDGPSAARGFLGLAMVAVMRGNLPLVRKMFERALLHSHPGSNTRGLAHMGLSNVARREGLFADALLHGWQAHDLTTNEDERLGIVGNLSRIALDAGFPTAAMSGFLHVLSTSGKSDNVLGILQDALLAAAVLRDEIRLREFEARALHIAHSSQQPFELARIHLTAATAWQRIGRDETARSRLDHVLHISREHGYHELVVRAESAIAELDRPVESDRVLPAKPSTFTTNTEFVSGIERLAALHA
jgi:hypothetical protein